MCPIFYLIDAIERDYTPWSQSNLKQLDQDCHPVELESCRKNQNVTLNLEGVLNKCIFYRQVSLLRLFTLTISFCRLQERNPSSIFFKNLKFAFVLQKCISILAIYYLYMLYYPSHSCRPPTTTQMQITNSNCLFYSYDIVYIVSSHQPSHYFVQFFQISCHDLIHKALI